MSRWFRSAQRIAGVLCLVLAFPWIMLFLAGCCVVVGWLEGGRLVVDVLAVILIKVQNALSWNQGEFQGAMTTEFGLAFLCLGIWAAPGATGESTSDDQQEDSA